MRGQLHPRASCPAPGSCFLLSNTHTAQTATVPSQGHGTTENKAQKGPATDGTAHLVLQTTPAGGRCGLRSDLVQPGFQHIPESTGQGPRRDKPEQCGGGVQGRQKDRWEMTQTVADAPAGSAPGGASVIEGAPARTSARRCHTAPLFPQSAQGVARAHKAVMVGRGLSVTLWLQPLQDFRSDRVRFERPKRNHLGLNGKDRGAHKYMGNGAVTACPGHQRLLNGPGDEVEVHRPGPAAAERLGEEPAGG